MNEIKIEVWGDFACFSRPESKVERLTYPVMTPSAARGILSAIYSKPPEFYWQIRRIEVLKPIKYLSFKRNEVINSSTLSRIGAAEGNLNALGGSVHAVIRVDATRATDCACRERRGIRRRRAVKRVVGGVFDRRRTRCRLA